MTNIPWERSKLATQGLDIRLREQWGAARRYTEDRPCQVPANDFFLHVAVVNDPGDHLDTEDEVARKIERIGISRFPNTGVSYNALAFNTGRLYEAQPLTRRGAHTVNDKNLSKCPTHAGSLVAPSRNLNVTCRALCLPQQPDDPVTDAQMHAAAKWAAAQIRAGLAKPSARWHGHRDVAWKDCPGTAGFKLIPELQRLTGWYVKNGLAGRDVTLSAAALNMAARGEPQSATWWGDARQFMAFAHAGIKVIPATTFWAWHRAPFGSWRGKLFTYAIKCVQARARIPQTGRFDAATAQYMERFGYTITQ